MSRAPPSRCITWLARARIFPTLFLTPPYLRMANVRGWYRWDRIHGLASMARFGTPFEPPIPFTPYALRNYWRPLTNPWQPLPEPRPDTRLRLGRRQA